MEIPLFFTPVDYQKINFDPQPYKNRIGNQIRALESDFVEDDLESFDLVLLGVNDDRVSPQNKGCAQAPDEIRKYLYRLFTRTENLKIGDLGNIAVGNQISDTYFALRTTIAKLLRTKVIPIVIGGSVDLTYPIYLGYEDFGRVINLVSIDESIQKIEAGDVSSPDGWLSKIIYRKPNFLFNFSNIGYQTYFTDPDEIKLLNQLYFDVYRLGEIRDKIEEAEPILRNADLLSFNVSAIRHADAPGNGQASPHGFFGEEACQLMRYAGLSSKISCVGFFESNPLFDPHGQTAHLLAQMIWHFLEGFAKRSSDFPDENSEGFIKYIVNSTSPEPDLVFYKCKTTDRWWMQLPVSREKEKELCRHIMVPCSYNDYTCACNNEIPDRWWKAYQKLM